MCKQVTCSSIEIFVNGFLKPKEITIQGSSENYQIKMIKLFYQVNRNM